MEEGENGDLPSDETTAVLPRPVPDTGLTVNEIKVENADTLNTTADSSFSNPQVVENVKKETASQNPEEKLADWLQHTARGIGNIKFTKRRWFKLIEESCKLYMYRDPQDLVPLAEINIASSAMYFDPGNHDKPGLFHIKSDGKETILDAGNRRKMMYWVQALQAKRREFNLSRSFATSSGVDLLSNKRASNLGGLLSKDSGSMDGIHESGSIGASDILDIQVSDSDLSDRGSNSSINSIPSAKISLRGLNNFKIGFQQKWSAVKLPGSVRMMSMMKNRSRSIECLGRPSRESQFSDSIFYCDIKPRSDSGHISISSVNSNNSQGEEIHCLLSGNYSDPGKIRTASQISQSSNDSQDLERTLCSPSSHHSSRSMESWTLLEKSDSITEEEANFSDSNTDSDSGTLKKNTVPVSVRRHGNVNVTDVGKSMINSTLSSLKKIRFGRRQVSEPGVLSQGMPPSGRDVSRETGKLQGHGQASSTKDISDLEEELQANRDIISLLQQQVSNMSLELVSRKEGTDSTEEEKALKLLEKDKLICTLEHQLSKLKQENTETMNKLASNEDEMRFTQDQLQMFTDMLKAKDEVIVSLSNQIQTENEENRISMPRSNSFDQPDVVAQSISPRDSTTSSNSTNSTNMERVNIKELEKYKDTCQGYELQHKLLVKEILEMNDLRKDDMVKEKKLAMDLEQMRAKYCQIKSKYYVLLQQFKAQEPVRGDGENQEIVNQLLNDALEPEEDSNELRLTGSIEEYDRYGFSRKHFNGSHEEEDEDELVSKAAMLDRQSEEISTHVKEADQTASLLVKWENHLARGDGKLMKCLELKTLIRQGIPHRYRTEVWKSMVNFQISKIREKNGPQFYQNLLQQKAAGNRSDPSVKQIELDLLRTLPNNRHYETIESEGVVSLRRVLLAFSEYNRDIGYCQGLNRLAAIALLFLEEEEAFWCLVAIVDYLLPAEYFSSTLMAAQADQRVLKDLVQYKLPAVHQKLEANNVDLSLFTFNWFLTVFVDNVPTEMFLRIWDTFLYEGSKVLFRFAIAFLKKSENEILKQKDGLQLNRYLRTIGEKMTNVRQISWFAFHWINPFRMRLLATKRQQHLQEIKGELKELDRIRHGMRMERENSTKEEVISDDESEN